MYSVDGKLLFEMTEIWRLLPQCNLDIWLMNIQNKIFGFNLKHRKVNLIAYILIDISYEYGFSGYRYVLSFLNKSTDNSLYNIIMISLKIEHNHRAWSF